jgi:hypothetical protein
MRARKCVVLAVSVFLLGACGGGGGAPAPAGPELEQSFSLGLVRGDAPTAVSLVVTKPFEEPGTVELLDAPAGAFGTGGLPMALGGSSRFALVVVFTPPSPAAGALQGGTIPLLLRPDSGGAAYRLTLRLDAEIETPSAQLRETRVALGNAAVGETVPCAVRFENTSAVTPITVTRATLTDGDFSLALGASAVPAEVAPGSSFVVPLAYAPRGETNESSLLRVFHSAATDPLEATLEASGMAPQVVVEYGAVPLDPATGESDWLTLDVAAEGAGILLEVWGSPSSLIDLAGFEGPSGKVYDAGTLSGPLDWPSGYPAGTRGFLTVAVPDSARPEVQLEPGGGTYRFRLRDGTLSSTGLTVRATVSQRHRGEAAVGTIDVRVFLAEGLALADRSDPMRDPKLAATMKTLDAALGEHGIRLGRIAFASIPEAGFDVLASEDDVERMIAVCSPGTPDDRMLNLFLVNDISYGIAGVAGASPGPWSSRVTWAGVVVAYDAASGATAGVIAAHQVSHYLGWHGAAVLPGPSDAAPMLGHPLLNAGLPGATLSPVSPETQVAVSSMPPASSWCGTCSRAPVR